MSREKKEQILDLKQLQLKYYYIMYSSLYDIRRHTVLRKLIEFSVTGTRRRGMIIGVNLVTEEIWLIL